MLALCSVKNHFTQRRKYFARISSFHLIDLTSLESALAPAMYILFTVISKLVHKTNQETVPESKGLFKKNSVARAFQIEFSKLEVK